ncbi:hypothetical protein J6590_059272 [Homalodisca vitripennis]|nr:hypothetical protein J6590_059272 [Homalodisca vitripennis]
MRLNVGVKTKNGLAENKTLSIIQYITEVRIQHTTAVGYDDNTDTTHDNLLSNRMVGYKGQEIKDYYACQLGYYYAKNLLPRHRKK